MSDVKRRYLRVYFDDLEADAPEVWFDPTCLSTYIRLLALSEKAWPSMPTMPRAVRRADLAVIQGANMIEYLPNDRFLLRGWRKEREGRAAKASASANARWDATADANALQPDMQSQSDRNAARAPASSSSSVGTSFEQETREAFPAIDSEAQTFLEGITHRLIRQAGDKQLAEYDRQIADHGLAAVISAYQRCAKAIRGTPTATQLVWSGRKILEPFVDPRAVADAEKGVDDEKRSARRSEGIWKRRIEAFRLGGVWDAAWGDPPAAA